MSTNPKGRAWMQVRGDALRRNFARVRAAVGETTRLIAMVKADAYGLGVAETVSALAPEEPWGWGVASLDEGLELRRLGVGEPVLVLCPLTEDELEPAIAAELQVSVSTLDALDQLVAASRRVGVAAWMHVDVDTGMGRTGFDWREADAWAARVSAAADRHVRWVGIFTHLHSADEGDDSVREQWRRFDQTLENVPSPPEGPMAHVLNSAGAFRTPEYAAAAVRPGIFLYGGEIGADLPRPEPVVSVHARVVHLRDAAPGTTLGYGATYRADRRERWATLSIGYGDGLPRALGNRGSVLVGGTRVPIVGRISMDLTVVDISDAPGVGVGDVATLVGEVGREAITVDDVARLSDTISYEILVGFTPRLPRIWTGLDGA